MRYLSYKKLFKIFAFFFVPLSAECSSRLFRKRGGWLARRSLGEGLGGAAQHCEPRLAGRANNLI
ncbi:hypothetical protein COT49_03365 [candidate division WWE3 bacterium CG08_land_8_20_14_0_20_40_13]|uniref:Uncharacterized protein n=1 Tax=candidate division WWE3 bacterium CG08_land_8_20_14_0_20_40_13 TaxID=1975084 RepID=A0A2H0XD08_UNCKA|nr:MAG: hypothetical protein COT49_03365 [candidate division WWE3 bacterium CG08_land_8_20_14_0_20_40_13]